MENSAKKMKAMTFKSNDERSTALGGNLGDLLIDTSKEPLAKQTDIVASVMVIEAISIKEELVKMKLALEELQKDSQEKNVQITALKRKLEKRPISENSDDSKTNGDGEKSKHDDDDFVHDDDDVNSKINSLSTEQIQEMIEGLVKSKFGGSPSDNHLYMKPYTKRVDELKMSLGYKPPKFQQFDGKGNPKQHIAHFVETYSNAGTDSDILVQQFVRSLKGMAFDWYTDLAHQSIDSWEKMEEGFLNRFYSTRLVVSMVELTNTKQKEGEPVIDFINCWRALSLECKDRLSEISAVEMCIQGMNLDLVYILQGIKPRTFEELASS